CARQLHARHQRAAGALVQSRPAVRRHQKLRYLPGTAAVTSGSGAELLEAARALRPRILAERDRIEAGRRLPEDLTRGLARQGYFRLFLPKGYGGLDLAPTEGLEVLEELARADASVAWCVWNGNTHWIVAQLSPKAVKEVHGDVDVVTANSTRASG